MFAALNQKWKSYRRTKQEKQLIIKAEALTREVDNFLVSAHSGYAAIYRWVEAMPGFSAGYVTAIQKEIAQALQAVMRNAVLSDALVELAKQSGIEDAQDILRTKTAWTNAQVGGKYAAKFLTTKGVRKECINPIITRSVEAYRL